jgi:two-component system sensor histidine kinase/response regulator
MPTILIVDDNAPNRLAMRMALHDKDYVIREAASGRDALLSLAHINPDLILLDIMMPEMDGYKVCQQLRQSEQTATMPVIFVTAVDDDVDRMRGFEVGGSDYITKPFLPEELAARVDVHLQAYLRQRKIEEMRQQDRDFFNWLNQERDNLLEQLQHDVRSPLSRIKVAIHLAKRAFPDNPTVQKYIRLTNSAVADTNALIASFLEIIKLGTGRYLSIERVSIRAFLQEIAEIYQDTADNEGIQFTTIFDPVLDSGEVICRVDPLQMKRVLQNLIDNAIKFTNHGGEVTLESKTLDNSVYFIVSDTGPGIAPADTEHIFQRFHRAESAHEQEGSGLGLYIAKEIVTQHEGRIWVESTLGKGSTFYVSIPISS